MCIQRTFSSLGDVSLAFKFEGRTAAKYNKGIEFAGISFLLAVNFMISKKKFLGDVAFIWLQLYKESPEILSAFGTLHYNVIK